VAIVTCTSLAPPGCGLILRKGSTWGRLTLSVFLRCGHCKALAPEWKKAAGNLKGKVKLGAVDCTVETSLASKYDVKGFPTILVFGADKQSPQPYEEGRTALAIESYALRVLEMTAVAPEVVELTSQVRVPSSWTSGMEKHLSCLEHVGNVVAGMLLWVVLLSRWL
jgi:hypothetical protein